MRGFLFDENLPRVPSLQTRLPVTHALDLGSRPTDSQLWAHARANDLAIVTKGVDFSQRIVLSVPPPRVIHLRVGNLRSRDFVAWLEHIWPRIESTIATHKLLNLYRDRIEAVK
jgi:predicted nuclease of predicted toxin-antitoxin system